MAGPQDPFEDERLRAEVHARLFGGGGAAPASIGPWRVHGRIGKGAMGTVYRATSQDGTREAAVKVVLGRSEHGERRLRREGRALRELVHPNIVGILEVGEFEHGAWVAMELVHGESLRRVMATPRPVESWVALLAPVGDALEVVRAAGLVHRDIKPDNVLIDDGGAAKLVDFGLAKPEPGGAATELSHLRDPLTRTGASVGTIGYASPEQMLGNPVDHRSDQFGLAATMWEAIVGRPAFVGATADAVGLAAIAGRIAAPPAGFGNTGVLDVLRRAMNPDPQRRFGDSGAFVAALRRAAS